MKERFAYDAPRNNMTSCRLNEKGRAHGPAFMDAKRRWDQPAMRYFTKPSGASPIFSTLMPAGW